MPTVTSAANTTSAGRGGGTPSQLTVVSNQPRSQSLTSQTLPRNSPKTVESPVPDQRDSKQRSTKSDSTPDQATQSAPRSLSLGEGRSGDMTNGGRDASVTGGIKAVATGSRSPSRGLSLCGCFGGCKYSK